MKIKSLTRDHPTDHLQIIYHFRKAEAERKEDYFIPQKLMAAGCVWYRQYSFLIPKERSKGHLQKIRRFYWRLSWTFHRLLTAGFERKDSRTTGKGDTYSSWSYSLCLPLPCTLNPTLSLALKLISAWKWVAMHPKILSRTGCLPPNSKPRLPRFCKTSFQFPCSMFAICPCCLQVYHLQQNKVTVLEGLLTHKQTMFFQLSYGADCGIWLLWKLSELWQYIWVQVASYIPCFLHILLYKCQGERRQG